MVALTVIVLGCAAAQDPAQSAPVTTMPGESAPATPSRPVDSPVASEPVDSPPPSSGPGPTESTVPSPSPDPTAPLAAGEPPELDLELVADGLSAPVYVTHAGGDSLWVVEQPGRIRIIDDGRVRDRLFLDHEDAVACCREQGMLGLAFHPEYETNGRFFLTYSDLRGDLVLSEFARGAPDRADPASERVVLRIPLRDYDDHYGGMLEFGDDGYLYFSTGDGGGISDPGRNAQDPESLLGKILRLDVNGDVVAGQEAYRIPANNPFVGLPGRDEIWSYGFRNPWRFSFDALTGELWVGDVGQDRYEEVSRHSDGRGANFGWDIAEARHCNRPRQRCDRTGLVEPIVEYGQIQGVSQAILGGYVYRGSGQPALQGWYLFAETYEGPIWAIPSTTEPLEELPEPFDSGLFITSFGEDVDGEILLTAFQGAVYRVIAVSTD
ncbi:MAG: PQQ-dependent sugar dehydrogenase [Chloroflexi bacterium]|nr:PQQ-dependent sugar dehydrogenase [Chloroflexota bacterium]